MNAWSPVTGWRSQAQAWAVTQGQLAWYRAMEALGEMRQVRTRGEMEALLAEWSKSGESRVAGDLVSSGEGELKISSAQSVRPVEKEPSAETPRHSPPATRHSSAPVPIGYILSLEGADSLLTPAYLERSYADGLRAIGPAHYGPGVYANGTDATGRLPERGRELIREIDRLGLILDATHLCDDCFWEALELFRGPVWASHHLSRALVPHNRQLSDEMFRALIERGAVVGVALDAWMIVPGWQRGKTTPQSSGVMLSHLADHIDHYCQLAGNARHIGIGSDLDGGFGIEQTPQDLDTIADLQKLTGILAERGYSPEDIEGIFNENFLRFLRGALPE
jgi:membrane dipeptidase